MATVGVDPRELERARRELARLSADLHIDPTELLEDLTAAAERGNLSETITRLRERGRRVRQKHT